MKIYEHDHFHKEYEDFRNNLYLTVINDDITVWLYENIIGGYDINVDDYYEYDQCNYIFIDFENEEDAVAFKLRWL